MTERQARIEAIRKQIAAGTYHVDSEVVAAAILRRLREERESAA